jgi:TorA maturation chaperone TorD
MSGRNQFEAEYLSTGLVGRILAADLTESLCASLHDEQVFMDYPPLCNENSDTVSGIELLQNWTRSYSDEVFDQTYRDYMVLLVGVGMPKAPPWESVYRTAGALLFQQETVDVRAWYRRFGKQIVNKGREPEDHIGYELEFVSFMTSKILLAYDAHDNEELTDLTRSRARFLGEHLLTWASQWCSTVLTHAKGDFYKGIALYLRGLLEYLECVQMVCLGYN